MEVKKAIRLLGPLMLEGVLSVRNNFHGRIVESLHDLSFVTRNVSTTNDRLVIELQMLDEESLYRMLAGEANRFLLASRISHERSNQDQLNNASWQIVENYYAAYYSVHYLLRLTGVSVTNLNSQSVQAIERSLLGTNLTAPIVKGLYVITFDEASKTLTLKKNLEKKGGSHQDAWQLWEKLVSELLLQANSDPEEYAGIAMDLIEHRKFLNRSSGKFNPPEIRGEINYQFIGRSWSFEQSASDSISNLKRIIASSRKGQLPISKTPAALVSNNQLIIELAKSVFNHASDKYPKGICRSISNRYPSYVN